MMYGLPVWDQASAGKAGDHAGVDGQGGPRDGTVVTGDAAAQVNPDPTRVFGLDNPLCGM